MNIAVARDAEDSSYNAGETRAMTEEKFQESLHTADPPEGLTAPLQALWWDGRGEWSRAHSLVDDLETAEGMAVHAYLHRKEGEQWNADYWYRRAGRTFHRESLADEWSALVKGLLANCRPR